MFKQSKSTKKAVAKAQKNFLEEVGEVAEKIGDSVRKGSANAIEASGPYLEKANALIHDATEAAAPKLRDASQRLQVTADNVRAQAGPRLAELNEQGKARAAEVRARLGEQGAKYAPEVAERVADTSNKAAGLLAAATVPAGVENAIVKVTGDKKAVKKAQKAAQKQARKFAKQAKKAGKDVAKSAKAASGVKKNTAGKWFLWIFIFGALAGVAYFIWKKAQPVEDPWSTPLPGNRPADARPVGSHDTEGGAAAPVVTEVAVPADKAEEAEAAEDAEKSEAEKAAEEK